MSNQHGLLPNSELHVPKDFEPAVTGTQAWKDERDQYSWETRFELPPVLNIVDNTVAPPTEVDGDIYIIDNSGASHADWDGATANSWVRFSLADDAWNEVEEATGMFVYDKSSGDYYFFDSSAWVAFGGGVGSSSFIGLTDTPANYTAAANKFVRVNAGATATEFVAASAINISTFNNDSGFTADQTSIVGITGTKAQFDTALTDGNFMYIGDAPTAHTHLLAAGATDVTATAAEVNLLDLAGLTVGYVLSADSATTASWKAAAGGDTGNILDTGGLSMAATRTHTLTNTQSLIFENSDGSPIEIFKILSSTGGVGGDVVAGSTIVKRGVFGTPTGTGATVLQLKNTSTLANIFTAFNSSNAEFIRVNDAGNIVLGGTALSGDNAVHVTNVLSKGTVLKVTKTSTDILLKCSESGAVEVGTGTAYLGVGVIPSASIQAHIKGQATGAVTPLRVDTSAIDNALLVNSDGRIGINTTGATDTYVDILSKDVYAMKLRHASNTYFAMQPEATTGISEIQFREGTGSGSLQGLITMYNSTHANSGEMRISGNDVLSIQSHVDIIGSHQLSMNSTQILTTRQTGWGAPTGTATRTTFATTTVTTEQLAERVKGLIDNLTTHGLIGA